MTAVRGTCSGDERNRRAHDEIAEGICTALNFRTQCFRNRVEVRVLLLVREFWIHLVVPRSTSDSTLRPWRERQTGLYNLQGDLVRTWSIRSGQATKFRVALQDDLSALS